MTLEVIEESTPNVISVVELPDGNYAAQLRDDNGRLVRQIIAGRWAFELYQGYLGLTGVIAETAVVEYRRGLLRAVELMVQWVQTQPHESIDVGSILSWLAAESQKMTTQ